jgi:hypothetical protein
MGLIFMIGLSTAYGAGDDSGIKQPKNTGTLTVRTNPTAFPLKIDGVDRGLAGTSTATIYYLSPGKHIVTVIGPNGKEVTREVTILVGHKNCICLKVVETTTKRPCPYNFTLDGPEKIMEGDSVTFAAINSGTAPDPLVYKWNVTNGTVRNGLGTATITVDSTGFGGTTINAELDVNDGVYDNKCRQVISVPTEVGKKPEPPKPYVSDEFFSKSADEDKARLDNISIQVQNTRDAQLYIIINPGTDKLSTTRNTYDRLFKRTLDYLVNTRHVDAGRITIVKGSPAERTNYQVWIVPPGAKPPVAQ